jgi:phenylacetate-CoA ligase
MTLAARLRELRYRDEIAAEQRSGAVASAGERRRQQLELLNAEWRRASADVPYLERIRSELALPERFGSLEEFAARVPVTTRDTVRREGVALASRSRPGELVRMTGGSTSSPVQLAAWASEFTRGRAELWAARAAYGITPASRLFMIWGHSHLLGTGLAGKWRGVIRRVSDRLLGYHRFSAYDLRPEALRRAAAELLRFRPDWVLGYSVALDQFARANLERRDELRRAGVRLVVATAESLPAQDSAERISDLLACPVASEYGAVETGLIAHTHPDGGYRACWRSLLLEAERSDTGHRLRVTTLTPRCTPLVRYEIGDEIELGGDSAGAVVGVDAFERVIGRCNDYIPLPSGARIHSEAFSHALRPCAEIASFQVAVGDAALRIRYVARADLSEGRLGEIRERLRKIHPELAAARFERVDRIHQSVAGKTPMIVAASGVAPAVL